MEKLRIGIIGTGGISNSHVKAYQQMEDVEIVAGADIVPGKAREALDRWNLPQAKAFENTQEMLDTMELDAVSVCTYNTAHAECAIQALRAGCHVLLEKPMTVTLEDAQAVRRVEKETGKILTIGYQNRFRKEAMYLKDLADQDYFGEIYYAEAIAIRRRAVPTWGVFIDEEKQGGGPLIDIGTHALDLTLFAMNNYEPAYCVGKTYHKLNKQTGTGNAWGDWDTEKFTAEDSAFGFVVMKNGATINLRSSWALNYANPLEAATTVCGDKAGAELTWDRLRVNGVMNGRQYILEPDFKTGGVAFFDGAGATDAPGLEAICFTNAIQGKGNLYVTAEQAACVTRILEGIYESQKTGKPYYFD